MIHTKTASADHACADARDEIAGPRAARRSLLKSAAVLAAVLPWLTAVPHVMAQAKASKVSKAAMKYQDTPSDGKECDDCLQFIPGPSRTAHGTCKLVDGSINPHGYCIAFVPKPKRN